MTLLVSLCVAGAAFFGALALLLPGAPPPGVVQRRRPRARRVMVLRPRS